LPHVYYVIRGGSQMPEMQEHSLAWFSPRGKHQEDNKLKGRSSRVLLVVLHSKTNVTFLPS